MNRNIVVGLLGGAVASSCIALMTGATSAWLVAVSGLFFVVGGTLLTSIVSEGYARVESLVRKLPLVFSDRQTTRGADETIFLQVAMFYRRGSARQAEMTLKGIQDPFLQLGTQLIIDRCSEKELTRALQWHTSNAQEQERKHLRILHSMAGFAPAFGMLGTLLGLVRLLFNLGAGDLDLVGSAMGFAMITTVYGLVTSNLILKPLIIKMEQRMRERLAWQRVKFELMTLLYERCHPAVIEETLNAFLTGKPTHMRPAGIPPTSMASA